MITKRPSSERGHFDHGWLDTYHTFSFGEYDDPAHRGFRSLRVINDDRVKPGMGFGMHPHRDMEIITYVLEGQLQHTDSMGNGSVIKPGDVQHMSAGTGVFHSEFNPSKAEPVHLLQIWIMPDKKGHTPGYGEKSFSRADRTNRLQLVASRDGADGSMKIHQDARMYATVLEKGQSVKHPLNADRHAWLHVARGAVRLNGEALTAGDGVAVSDERELAITSDAESELLLFDLS
jgi:redox-sensitive bicupin YhaK (pirin superfamily)